MLWFSLAFVALVFIFIHGIDYVNWPRLLPLSDIVHYDGPGFREAHNGKGLGIPALDSRSRGEKGVGMEKGRRRAGSKLSEVEMGNTGKSRVD